MLNRSLLSSTSLGFGALRCGAASIRLASTSSSDIPSFARNVFLGRIEESGVFPYPDTLSAEERETLNFALEPWARYFRDQIDPAAYDKLGAAPTEILDQFKEMGAFGIQVPPQYGGLGLTNTGYARLGEVMGGVDLGISIILGAHQSIGFKGILLYGNEQQKSKYLPDLATGKTIAAFCLTEPTSGSDANSIRTRAVLSDDKKHWILNGGKIWISNGGLAEIFTVFAQTPCYDPKTGGTKDKVTAFIVERKFGGLTHGNPEDKMGIKCSNTAEVHFDNVKIPVENVLGDVGGGFKVAMNILNNGRFGMGAALTGTMKHLISVAADHATNRTQFGRKIKDFGLIKEKIAQMTLRAYAAESVAYMLSSNMDRGVKDFQIEAAVSKVFASEAAWFVADETLQVLGGTGFMKSAGVERVVRDLRIFRIFEGTNEILRLLIGLTGVEEVGKSLKGLNVAIQNPFAHTDVLARELKKRAEVLLRLDSAPKFQTSVHGALKQSSERIEESVHEFGKAVEGLVMKHKKGIVEQQMMLRRVADCVIDLYSMAAVVSRADRAIGDNFSTASHEILLANTWCRDANSRIRRNLSEIRGDSKVTDADLAVISDQVVAHGGFFATHPVRL